MLRQAVSAELRPIVAATFADRVAGNREARSRFLRLAVELDRRREPAGKNWSRSA